MLSSFATGFGVGFGLIVAIGAQNAFVLRQGILRQHVFAVVAICAISDALLIAAGVMGLGRLVQSSPILLKLVTGGGIAFLLWYGWLALSRALKPSALDAGQAEAASSLKAAITTCLLLTFANPHVYLDTVVLIGAISAGYEGVLKQAFMTGAMVSSLVWFVGLGYGARLLAPIFARPMAWRVLDLVICAVMWVIALRLVWWLRQV
ncbi:MAG: LysE/ArgO family amino acid transporter [Bosea sp. (in: a-proteobacteria)]